MIDQPITRAPQTSRTPHTVTVLDAREETPSIHLLRVSKPPGFDFRASSVARIHLETAAGVDVRPMSIASSPARDHIEFAVRRSDSAFKRAFVALEPGDRFQIEGPFGRFFLDPERPAILIAGGVGITPFKSMLEYAADAALTNDITLLFSNRAPSEIPFRDHLDALARTHRHIEIIHTTTRHTSQEWNGQVGRIDADLLRAASANKPDALYYLCGTPAMVDGVIEILRALGVPPEHIRSEQFRGYARHAQT